MNVTGEVAVSVFVIVSVALYVHLRFSGAILRSIPLPQGVDQTTITADLTDGVLNIFVPKTKEAQDSFKNVGISGSTTTNC